MLWSDTKPILSNWESHTNDLYRMFNNQGNKIQGSRFSVLDPNLYWPMFIMTWMSRFFCRLDSEVFKLHCSVPQAICGGYPLKGQALQKPQHKPLCCQEANRIDLIADAILPLATSETIMPACSSHSSWEIHDRWTSGAGATEMDADAGKLR